MTQTAITASKSNVRPKRIGPEVPHAALRALAAAVGTMHHAFTEHVARQEGPAGFVAFLLAAAPRYVDYLEGLRMEHQMLASSIGALRLKILRAETSQWEALVTEADALADALLEHEELEREMLRDGLEHP